MEYVQSITVVVDVETNKQTIHKQFDAVAPALEFLHSLVDGDTTDEDETDDDDTDDDDDDDDFDDDDDDDGYYDNEPLRGYTDDDDD